MPKGESALSFSSRLRLSFFVANSKEFSTPSACNVRTAIVLMDFLTPVRMLVKPP